jgi:hypothetical protein
MRARKRFGVTALVALCLWLGAPAPSQADPLVIHLPEGNFSVTGFNYQAGNALVTGLPSTGVTVGTTLETYYQSNAASVLGTNGLAIPGLGLNSTYEITSVARFTEVVTSITPTANGATASMALAGTQVNPFFEVWYHNGTLADNFNGTGFNTGTKIVSGVINNISSSNFAATTTSTVLIDNPNTNGGTPAGKTYWNTTAGGTHTITGTGAATESLATMQVNSVVLNPTFFPAGQTVLSYTLTPSTNLEYQSVDPSKFFSGNANGVAPATVASIPQGTTNGMGSSQGGSDRAVFELHDNDTISATSLPEPASLTLLVTGALGLLGYGWRRRKQAA